MDNINNEKYHQMALNKVHTLLKLNPTKESADGQELETLITSIEAYEDIHIPMKASDPIAYLTHKLEQDNLNKNIYL
jgi:HTH-type transcriptional regulator / antitoxin HigA